MGQKSSRALRRTAALLLAATALLGMSGTEPAFAASAAPVRVAYYVALGDSVPVWNYTHSYPYLIRAHYQPKLPGLRVANLAVSGETSTSMRDFQYPQALRFLRHHTHHVALITIDIGGNDIVACSVPAGLDPTGPCVKKAHATIKRNLSRMLAGLRKAAPGVPVIGMNYYDPYLGDWLAGGSARSFAIATVSALQTLNQELTRLYGGARNTADVQSAFAATDLTTIVQSPWGNIPIAVQRTCAWLDVQCQQAGPEGFGDDPNNVGAAVIATAFEHTIDQRCTRRGSAIFKRCRPGT